MLNMGGGMVERGVADVAAMETKGYMDLAGNGYFASRHAAAASYHHPAAANAGYVTHDGPHDMAPRSALGGSAGYAYNPHMTAGMAAQAGYHTGPHPFAMGQYHAVSRDGESLCKTSHHIPVM